MKQRQQYRYEPVECISLVSARALDDGTRVIQGLTKSMLVSMMGVRYVDYVLWLLRGISLPALVECTHY